MLSSVADEAKTKLTFIYKCTFEKEKKIPRDVLTFQISMGALEAWPLMDIFIRI